MNLRFHNAKLIDPRSKFHSRIISIHISEGIIRNITSSKNSGDSLDLEGAWIIPGIVDMSVVIPDPGLEYKEDIISGLDQARASGICLIGLLPEADPFIDTKGSIEYILSRAKGHEVAILPYGGLSKSGSGELMSELIDLREAGARAFSNGLRPISDTELLLKCLQYTKSFDGLVINRPLDPFLSRFGQMNEGLVSTRLGLKGIPDIAESLMVQRDLEVLEYTGGRLHFSGISSGDSLKLIQKAKKTLSVTCDVPIQNLMYSDEALETFDSNFKVNPPLRSEKNRKSLIKAVNTGVVDVITTDHQPQDSESKNLEFDLAEFGMIGMQTFIPNLIKLSVEIPLDILIEKISHAPGEILGLPDKTIEPGNTACLTIINPGKKWVLDDTTNLSNSRNTPLFNHKLIGTSIGIVNGEKVYLSEELIHHA